MTSMRVARRAGYQPATTPLSVEATRPHAGRRRTRGAADSPATAADATTSATDARAMPSTPPQTATSNDSATTSRVICRREAPSARRTPISRVRWLTDTSVGVGDHDDRRQQRHDGDRQGGGADALRAGGTRSRAPPPATAGRSCRPRRAPAAGARACVATAWSSARRRDGRRVALREHLQRGGRAVERARRSAAGIHT